MMTSRGPKYNHVQPKLKIGQPNDRFEQEADRVADHVLKSSRGDDSKIQRKCNECEEEELQMKPITASAVPFLQKQEEEEEETLQMKGLTGHTGGEASLQSSLQQSKGAGQPMDAKTQSFMGDSIGADFSDVKIHTDTKAVQMNRNLNARAFTNGSDVYFNRGQYNPQSSEGKHLLAHELTHVVQQNHAKIAPKRSSSTNGSTLQRNQISNSKDHIQRAEFKVGSVKVNVDFGGLHAVANVDLEREIESRFMTYASAADASSIHVALAALPIDRKRWVLYGLDLLVDNTKSKHARLNRTLAVQRLIDYAPKAVGSFTDGGFVAENEALRASGWFEIALTSKLKAPSSKDKKKIHEIVNPPVKKKPGKSAVLDTVNFHSRMEAGLRHLLKVFDPKKRGSVGKRSLPKLKVIADELMNEARDYFSPYADTSRTTVFGLHPAFKVSSNIYNTNTKTYSNKKRRNYLRNRGGLVGRNKDVSVAFPDTNIYKDVNYDGSDTTHKAELNKLIKNLLSDPNIVAVVNRLIENTGQQKGSGASTKIGLVTEYDSSKLSKCEARWAAIDTLCHEILHALAHPDFESKRVKSRGVLKEGFTEVLGVELFNKRVRPKAKKDPAFRARMEAGLKSCPSKLPEKVKVGYGSYGKGAKKILGRSSVSKKDFKAAFFLGQTHVIGL